MARFTLAAVRVEGTFEVARLHTLMTLVNHQSNRQSDGDSMGMRLAHGVRLGRTCCCPEYRSSIFASLTVLREKAPPRSH